MVHTDGQKYKYVLLPSFCCYGLKSYHSFLIPQSVLLDQHFGPLNLPPSVRQSVRQSVRPSVSHKSSHTSHHYFFLIFCNKLAYSKCRKVMKPDFRRKLLNFFYKQFFKK